MIAGNLTAAGFLVRLQALQSDVELQKIQRYFKSGEGQYAEGDRFIGVRMGALFDLAKQFVQLDPGEIEALLDSDIHEARAGALSIMAKQYALKSSTDARRNQLYELYLLRHDRIDNWDLVDLAAWHVVGAWLVGKDHRPLLKLARPTNLWERRTAILATFAFIKRGEFDDTAAIAELLLADGEDLIHKATGGMLREVGRRDPARLSGFLDLHAPHMPRTMLSYAIEHFSPADRARYRAMKPETEL